MTTRTINTTEIIEDIQSGMGDIPIMEKYELSPTEFFRILNKLESVSAIPPAVTQERKRSLQAEPVRSHQRALPRSYALFSIAIHDANDLNVTGRINDITENGLQITGIPVGIGDVKTLVIRSDVFIVQPPLVLEAECKWIRPSDRQGQFTAGYEITNISREDTRALRRLIEELTITSWSS